MQGVPCWERVRRKPLPAAGGSTISSDSLSFWPCEQVKVDGGSTISWPYTVDGVCGQAWRDGCTTDC